jgi:threonine dehydrogenase-like Zn-dependent dehydrogenase
MRLIAEKAADVSQIISDVVPIKELQRAYDIAEDAISMKVVLTAEGS